MGSQIQYWSTTPGSNQSVDPDIFSADSQSPATVDDNIRSIMAAVAKYHMDTDGGLTASGTANAITVTTSQAITAAQLTPGLGLMVRSLYANTSTAVTFAPDGLTAYGVSRADGSALAVGEIQPNMWLYLIFVPGAGWNILNISATTKLGVSDGSDAAGGQIGEFLSASNTFALGNGVPAALAGMSLTPGDWNVWGNVVLTTLAGGSGVSFLAGGISTVNNALGSNFVAQSFSTNIIQGNAGVTLPMLRASITANTSYYAVAQINFASGSPQAAGYIWARRVR
jgi:hypothetical protein